MQTKNSQLKTRFGSDIHLKWYWQKLNPSYSTQGFIHKTKHKVVSPYLWGICFKTASECLNRIVLNPAFCSCLPPTNLMPFSSLTHLVWEKNRSFFFKTYNSHNVNTGPEWWEADRGWLLAPKWPEPLSWCGHPNVTCKQLSSKKLFRYLSTTYFRSKTSTFLL